MAKDKYLDARKKMLEEMTRATEKAGLEVVTKEIAFINNNVPEFLERLDYLEEQSRRVKIIIIGSYRKAIQITKAKA